MNEYKFVRVEIGGKKIASEPVKYYQDMVNNYAKEGWRLMQTLTPSTIGYGTIDYYEFVFERQI